MPTSVKIGALATMLLSLASGSARADLFVSNLGGPVLRFDGTTGASLGTFVAAGSGGLVRSTGIAFGPDGNFYVGDEVTRRIYRYDGATGAFIDIFVPQDSGGSLSAQGITFGPDGHLYVSVSFNSQVRRYDGATGAFLGAFVPTGSGGLLGGGDIRFGPDGNLYVGSSTASKVLRYDGATGAFLNVAADATFNQGFTFGTDGLLYAGSGNQINRYDPITGTFLGVVVASGSGGLSNPADVEFGPDGNLYVISQGNRQVLRYDGTTGAFLDVFVPDSAGLNFGRFLLFTASSPEQVIPEPSTVALLALGALALIGHRWRRRRNQESGIGR